MRTTGGGPGAGFGWACGRCGVRLRCKPIMISGIVGGGMELSGKAKSCSLSLAEPFEPLRNPRRTFERRLPCAASGAWSGCMSWECDADGRAGTGWE